MAANYNAMNYMEIRLWKTTLILQPDIPIPFDIICHA